jgi:hypothetical protein
MRRIRCDVVVAEPTTAVELLTWVYRSQKADLMSGRDLFRADGKPAEATVVPPAWSRDGCAALRRHATLGAIIPGTAHLQSYALHPDAEKVHDLVVELSRHDPLGASLLRQHGRHGDTPDICDVIPHPEPVRRIRNRRERIVEDAILPGNSHMEAREWHDAATGAATTTWVEISYPYCPLRYFPCPATVLEARVEYCAWWRALAVLAGRLPTLERWRVTGMGAVERPWAWEEYDEAV